MLNQGIGQWVERKRERCRGDIAMSYFDTDMTYEEFADRINQLAHGLREQGIGSGDRIAYLGHNHPSFLEALFAVTTLGAIFVPLNTRLAPREIQYTLNDSGARMLLYQESLFDLAVPGSSGTAVERLVAIGAEPQDPQTLAYETLFTGQPTAALDVPVTLEDPAVILYTSGTTGNPKGAVITHGNITWNSFNVLVDYGVSTGEQVLLISPLFHVAALTNGAIAALLQGGTVVLHERFDPGHVLETIQEKGITMLSGVPTTFQMIQEHPAWESTDISSLRRLTCGGSAVPERTLAAYEERGLGFSVGYGMTETSPGATALPARKAQQKVGSSGLKHFFTDVKVVDPAGNELPAGEVGEIWISGPNVITEYWNRPEATAEAIVDGWLRSGDLGYFDEDGYIYISDRLKDMIISGGENIYSAEIEAVIMEIAEVESVAVVGAPHEKWGEVPVAHIRLHPGEQLTQEAVLAHLDGKLARYKIPTQVHFVDDFPRTASGKIQKSRLR